MARDRIGWLKIGLLSIIAIPLIFVAVVYLMARVGTGSGPMTEQVFVHRVGGTAAIESVVPTGAGTITIDVRGAELYMVPVPAGESIRVEALFDEQSNTFDEHFDSESPDGWNYSVEFAGVEDSVFGYLSWMFHREYPKLTIFVPRGQPMALDLQLAQGGGRVDLGGLHLTTADIEVFQGGLEIDVSESAVHPLERFSLNAAMGGVTVSSLGNASPQTVSIKQRMGGLNVDLTGDWKQDAKITAVVEMGGGALWVPDNVATRGLDADNNTAGNPETGMTPTLSFTVKANMGNIEVIR